ncbi:hypothetical protein [Nonomuraea dietziae]|uniref:hypothetical protein n=1 Tax=Nonomuraea dietziae TaxID=65515 RepID=UPI00341A10DB
MKAAVLSVAALSPAAVHAGLAPSSILRRSIRPSVGTILFVLIGWSLPSRLVRSVAVVVTDALVQGVVEPPDSPWFNDTHSMAARISPG